MPLAVELDRSSPVPLYYQLAQAIEAAIRDGELSPGDRFENELALANAPSSLIAMGCDFGISFAKSLPPSKQGESIPDKR